MRRLLKFLHTLGAIGLAGGLAGYMLLLAATPAYIAVESYTTLRESLAVVTSWLILPSILVVLISGLLAIAIHFPLQNAPWVWVKAVSGILIFEATLASVDAPARQAVAAAHRALAGEIDPAELARLVRDE